MKALSTMNSRSKDFIDSSIKFVERLSLVAGITAGTILVVHHPEVAPNQFLFYFGCFLLIGLSLVVTLLSALSYADDLGKAIDKLWKRNLTITLVYALSFIVGIQVIIGTAKIGNGAAGAKPVATADR